MTNPDFSGGLASLVPHYDALACDIWGVVHNGITPYPEAVEALVNFRQQGGRVVLVTNASRTEEPIRAMLDRMGVPRTAYDAMVTSGDVTRNLIRPFEGKNIHHVGPLADHPIFHGLDLNETPADQADAVVVTGPDNDEDTPNDYAERIALWLSRDLPLICSNPDKMVEIGNQMHYCAGAIADVYQEQGGKVLQAGKPFAPIYELALKKLETVMGKAPDINRVMAVGDSVRTDATGAAGQGIDFLFITGSLHAEELDAFGNVDPQEIARIVEPSGATLAGFMPRLHW